jgi:hypothetical protein
MTKYFDSADPKNWVSVDIPGIRGVVFNPKNGRVIDLPSLEAIADTANRVLYTHLQSRYPLSERLVVHGIELQGKYMSKGPPGIVRAKMKDLRISAGMAIFLDREGHRRTLVLDEEVRLLEHIEDNRDQVLVLSLEIDEALGIDGDALAYESCSERFSFVSREDAKKRHYIPIAKGLGGDFWFTDTQRVWQPDHEGIQLLNSYFDQLEDLIWDSDRHGMPANQQMLGMDWKLYQAKASSAVTAARCTLAGRSSTSEERIRTLRNLYWQLQRSVEDASLTLMTMLGKEESAIIDDYADVFLPFPEEWKR